MLRHAASMLPFFVRGGLGRRALVSCVHRRVRWVECDFNLHMNQASYARVAEMGRSDWLLRCGLAKDLWRARTNPIMAEQRIVYRRELRPAQRYALDTRATGLEGRTLLLQSHLLVGEAVHTAVYAKLLMVGPGGVMTPDAVTELVSHVVTDRLPIEGWRIVGGG